MRSPVSCGGSWAGTAVISEPGFFAEGALWRDLPAGSGLPTEAIEA